MPLVWKEVKPVWDASAKCAADIGVVRILEKWIALTRVVQKAIEDMPLYHIPGSTSVDQRECSDGDWCGTSVMSAHYGGWSENSETFTLHT